MQLEQTNQPASCGGTYPCRECGKPAEWVHTDDFSDERTASYCDLDENAMPWEPGLDVWFDIYECPECHTHTADLTTLMWFDDQEACFYLYKDLERIKIAPDQQSLF